MWRQLSDTSARRKSSTNNNPACLGDVIADHVEWKRFVLAGHKWISVETQQLNSDRTWMSKCKETQAFLRERPPPFERFIDNRAAWSNKLNTCPKQCVNKTMAFSRCGLFNFFFTDFMASVNEMIKVKHCKSCLGPQQKSH